MSAGPFPVLVAGESIPVGDPRHPAMNPHGPMYYAAVCRRRQIEAAGSTPSRAVLAEEDRLRTNVVQSIQRLYRGNLSGAALHCFIRKVRQAESKKAEAALLAALEADPAVRLEANIIDGIRALRINCAVPNH